MTIAQRLYLLIFSAFLALAGLAGFGIFQMNKVYTATNYANVDTIPSITSMGIASDNIAQLRLQVWQYLALSDASQREALEKNMKVTYAKVLDTFALYEKEYISNH